MLNRTLWVPLTFIDYDEWSLMFPGPSDEVDIECSRGHRSHEEDDNLPTLDELLFGVGGAQEPHRAQSRDKHGMGGSDSTIEHPAQNDCNHVPILGPKQRGDKGEDSDSNSPHLSSGDSTCEEQSRRHYFSTPPTVAGLEVGYDP